MDSLDEMVTGVGEMKLSLIFSDPMGHSKILHDNAKFQELTQEQIEQYYGNV